MKRKGHIVLISLFVVLIFIFISPVLFAFIRSNKADSRTDLEQINSINLQTISGDDLDLTSYSPKILVINSWSTWCTFCVDELPDFVELQDKYPNEIIVVAINRAEPVDANKTFFSVTKIPENGLIFLLDPDDQFYSEINGVGMPETIFINRDGNIAEHVRGPMDLDKMESIVEKLLQENI